VKDSTFRGQMMLVFFGYTHCPDICPTTMQAVGDAIDSLGQKGELVRPVFITVDPQRDTVARTREFAENFHPRLAALTGSPEEIAQAAKAYRVYYRKAPPQPGQSADDYLMDHSSFLFLMGTDGRYLTHFPGNATADEIAEGVKKYL
jgi:cytochrome oxidase Cu insertion factor (SCO1/SenC/PrrC family)